MIPGGAMVDPLAITRGAFECGPTFIRHAVKASVSVDQRASDYIVSQVSQVGSLLWANVRGNRNRKAYTEPER